MKGEGRPEQYGPLNCGPVGGGDQQAGTHHCAAPFCVESDCAPLSLRACLTKFKNSGCSYRTLGQSKPKIVSSSQG